MKSVFAKVIPIRPPTPIGDDGDATLVVRATEGAAWAKRELFARHGPSTFALLTRLLSSTSDAEDATQDAFVEALRHLPRLKDPQRFGGWLRQIAVRQAHRRFRRRRLLRTFGIGDAALDASLDLLADESTPADSRAQLAEIHALLESLPATVRSCWMLRHVEGMDLAEIGESLGISLATVKRKIALAAEELADFVREEEAP